MPLLLFTLPPFLPAPFSHSRSLFQSLGIRQMQGFVSVPNRWSVILPNKSVAHRLRDLSPKHTRQPDETLKMNDNNDDGEFTWRFRYTWSHAYIYASKCGWGGLNCSPSLLSWEPRLSVTQTNYHTWLASEHMNTDAIKPSLCLANTYWQPFSQSSVCVCVCKTQWQGEVKLVVHLQCSVCWSHTVSLALIKMSSGPLYP